MNDKEKMLGLMRFWLFGTFIIVFAATTVFLGGPYKLGTLIFGIPSYWVSMVATALLCVGWYYVYKWYLDRQK
ncbi:MAG: hypothetical protein Fur0022_23070 [Anaerolineales bacterium]